MVSLETVAPLGDCFVTVAPHGVQPILWKVPECTSIVTGIYY